MAYVYAGRACNVALFDQTTGWSRLTSSDLPQLVGCGGIADCCNDLIVSLGKELPDEFEADAATGTYHNPRRHHGESVQSEFHPPEDEPEWKADTDFERLTLCSRCPDESKGTGQNANA